MMKPCQPVTKKLDTRHRDVGEGATKGKYRVLVQPVKDSSITADRAICRFLYGRFNVN